MLQTFLTDTHECFIIVETLEDTYEIYQINLDSEDPRINSPIFKYSFDDVDGTLLNGFHARGSSSKEKINLNKRLIIFMQHGSTLWAWKQGDTSIEKIDENVSNMYYQSDDQIFYMTTEEICLSCDKKVMHS